MHSIPGNEERPLPSRGRLLASLLAAPVSAPLAMLLILFVSPAPLRKLILDGASRHTGAPAGPGAIFLSGAAASYAFAVVIGVPFYLLFRKIDMITFWTLALGGASIAVAPFFLMDFLAGNNALLANAALYPVLAVCGFCVGAVFRLMSLGSRRR
ncbi:MAG: hypothetical protein M0042_06775 [Nitrospiraceae bacterium]|nr:hypothetical protein [Nitrospiraceae bacterium]